MYTILLILHNIVRWVVLFLGLFVTGRSLWGWLGNRNWDEKQWKFGLIFTSSVDLQLLLGILLYFIFSDWGLKAILDRGMSFVMRESEFRFFAIEHVFYMLVGVIFAHLGSVLPKKIDEPRRKYLRATILFGVASVLILAGIPWSRPLIPGF